MALHLLYSAPGMRRALGLITLFALVGCSTAMPQDDLDCAAAGAKATGQPRAWPPSRPGYANPIPAENLLDGTADWAGGAPAAPAIEAYADHVSASVGQAVQVMARTDHPRSVHWQVFRLGWYNGAGARLMLDGGSFDGAPQDDCPRDATTAMVRCTWPASFQFTVGKDWVSGLYLVRLDADQLSQYVPLIVTDDRPADLLVQVPVTTWQAYNTWGGESLYVDQSGTMPDGRALAVSFDRPYMYQGAPSLLEREVHLARFLERYGYDVTYTTNIDVAAGGWENLVKRGAFISVGHDEYWPRAQRNAIETARDMGVPLLFFGANDAYWKVRLEKVPAGQLPRSFTCYKNRPDPDRGAEITGQYRSLNRPESGLIGEMYESWVYRDFPWVVADEDHFIFEGTGLHNGDALPLLVGDEYDRTFGECMPTKLRIAAHSPLVDSAGRPRAADTTTYWASSGALVFAAGTIDWAQGLGQPGAADWRIARITANLLHAALGLAVPDIAQDPTPEPAAITYEDASLEVTTTVTDLTTPTSLVVTPDGTTVVVELDRNQVTAISPSGTRKLLATGRVPLSQDPQGLGLRQPTSIALDPAGNLYISDTGNHCIRKWIAKTKNLVTFAGQCATSGSTEGTGVGAQFNTPLGLAVDVPHNRLIVADAGNNRIRAIDLTSAHTQTLAGSILGVADGPGRTALLDGPTAVAVADDGRIFVIESGDALIAVIAPDTAHHVKTIVHGLPGLRDGTGTSALLGPQGGAVWAGDKLIISDPTNYLLRVVRPGADEDSTQITTYAGSSLFGATDGPVDDATLGLPLGLALAADGSVLFADGQAGAIRLVYRPESPATGR
jgi:DNA-binding beta-propeller fold protein YncE